MFRDFPRAARVHQNFSPPLFAAAFPHRFRFHHEPWFHVEDDDFTPHRMSVTHRRLSLVYNNQSSREDITYYHTHTRTTRCAAQSISIRVAKRFFSLSVVLLSQCDFGHNLSLLSFSLSLSLSPLILGFHFSFKTLNL